MNLPSWRKRSASQGGYEASRTAAILRTRTLWCLTNDRALIGNVVSSPPAKERLQKPAQSSELLRKLTKVLGMLGSDHEGERAAAARKAEALRKELGLTWEQITR